MALTEENGMVMPVSPLYGGGNGGFGGGFGGDWGWIILLLLLAGGNGWGGGFGGGFGNAQLGYDFPWLLNGQNGINANTNNGFQNALLNDNITSIRDGIGNLSTQLCGCCGDIQMALANGFASVEQGANARQIANMQTAFGLQSEIANGNYNTALGFAGLGSDIAREACATRTTDTQNTQSILNTINGGIQSIKDQLCSDKIDAKNDEIARLRQEVLYARGQASQDVQTARILAGQTAEVDALYNRLNDCPVGTTPVYGRTPIFTCNNSGCGCGCNGGF